MSIQNPKQRLKKTFSWERTLCRLIASWCCFAAIELFGNKGFFYELSFNQDTSFLAIFLISAAFFAGLSVLNFFLNSFESDSWFLMLAATLCSAFWCLSYTSGGGNDKFLVILAIVVVYSLFAIYFVNRNDELLLRLRMSKRVLIILTSVFGVLSFSVIAAIGTFRYLNFATPNFDFGIFVNMFHNMKETGLPTVSSERDVLMSHFAIHISPIYYLILPFYCIFPSPITLQICQALIVASGIIPAVAICKHWKLSNKLTLAVGLIYALYPALSADCFYDIHENCFLAPLLLWLFYFFEKKNYPLMYIFALLTFAVKEDAAVYVFIFALFIIFSRRKYLHGAALAVLSVAYFGVALWILSRTSASYAELYADASPNPSIGGPMINRFNNLIFDSKDGLMGAVKTAFASPGYLLTQLFTSKDNSWGKIIYVLQMFLPLGFIPLCTKKVSRWLLLVPMLMNLLTYYTYQYDISFQYNFGVTAFLFYAFILNASELKLPSKKVLMTIASASCICLYLAYAMPTFCSQSNRYYENKESYSEMAEFLEQIPEDASVCASSFLISHIADRDEIYQSKYHDDETDVDYVVLDISDEQESYRATRYYVHGYRIVDRLDDRIIIMKKGEK